MKKQELIKKLEVLEENAIRNRDADTSEPNFSYQEGVAEGYRGAIYWLSKLDA